MKNHTKVSIFSVVVLCLIGIGIFTLKHNPTVHAADTSTPYHYGTLEKMYGLHFTSATLPASIGITKQQALDIGGKSGLLLGSPTDMIFGYLTINPKGNAVMVPSRDAAYSKGHGYLTNYPVWLVRNTVANVPILGPGPRNVTTSTPRGTIQSTPESMYEFIDANNGQVLFSVSVPNN
jgi:hypothetical protein